MRIEAVVPATSANLGPGYDCLGVALDIFSLRLSLNLGDAGSPLRRRSVQNRGSGADALPDRPEDHLVCKAMEAVFRVAGRSPEGYRLDVDNDIPLARGLGSSAAAVVGGVLLADAWLRQTGTALSSQEIERLAVALEGHGDNVMAAFYGGLTVTVPSESGRLAVARRVPVRTFPHVIVAVPETHQDTQTARRVLPASLPHQDAVFNVARVALLLTGFASGEVSLIGPATEDRLHEPYRQQLFPWFPQVKKAGLEAGALGVCLSGAGPSMLAWVSEDRAADVGWALHRAFQGAGVPAAIVQGNVGEGARIETVA